MASEFEVDFIVIETILQYGQASLALSVCRKYGECLSQCQPQLVSVSTVIVGKRVCVGK